LLDGPAVVARPELVAQAVIELVEHRIIDDEARRLEQPPAQEEPAAGVTLVVVEVVQALLVEDTRGPAGPRRVEEGCLAAEYGLAQCRFGSGPADDLPAVHALDSRLEASAGILVHKGAGHNRNTIVGLELGGEIQG